MGSHNVAILSISEIFSNDLIWWMVLLRQGLQSVKLLQHFNPQWSPMFGIVLQAK